MVDHDGNHRFHAEKNVPIALILPSRWQDGAESLGMKTTSCLCCRLFDFSHCHRTLKLRHQFGQIQSSEEITSDDCKLFLNKNKENEAENAVHIPSLCNIQAITFSYFFKMGHPWPLFRLFSSFQTNCTIFKTKQCEKM